MQGDAGTPELPQRVPLQRVIELAARWYVFLFLNVYGFGKICGGQFYRRGRLPEGLASTPLGEVEAFDLAWTFMGYSFTYILFIGLAEVVGAWLLLWNATKLLGVAVLLPIMLNILVFDVVFFDTYGALASATIYTMLLCVIAICNRAGVKRAVHALVSQGRSTRLRPRQWTRAAFSAAVIMGLFFAFDQMLVNLLGH